MITPRDLFIAGWLTNRHAAYNNPKDTARFASELADEIMKLRPKDEEPK